MRTTENYLKVYIYYNYTFTSSIICVNYRVKKVMFHKNLGKVEVVSCPNKLWLV